MEIALTEGRGGFRLRRGGGSLQEEEEWAEGGWWQMSY